MQFRHESTKFSALAFAANLPWCNKCKIIALAHAILYDRYQIANLAMYIGTHNNSVQMKRGSDHSAMLNKPSSSSDLASVKILVQ